ncbi:MAG TPA: hypothetical protein VNK24_11945 [Elusimicrobiota bacterium]|nr:hypothetical protein [Elusimicrobiota bacterium]
MKKACGVLSFVLPVLLEAGSALAAPYGMFRIVRSADLQPEFPPASLSAAQAPRLVHYYGGPAISHAEVYAVFWGRGVSARTRADIGAFYANILDSGYMDWLSEYGTDVQAMDGRAAVTSLRHHEALLAAPGAPHEILP